MRKKLRMKEWDMGGKRTINWCVTQVRDMGIWRSGYTTKEGAMVVERSGNQIVGHRADRYLYFIVIVVLYIPR